MSKNGPVDREPIIRDLAENHGISPEKAAEAVRFQFGFVARIMREGNYNAVRLPKFGIFKVKKGRKEHLDHAKAIKENEKRKDDGGD